MARQSALETVEITQPAAVTRRLAELGIPLEVLHESVRRGQDKSSWVTKAHPVGAAGSYAYHETNGELRGQLAARSWELSDLENIPRAISPDRQVVVTALSGNEHTGRDKKQCRGAVAQTKRPRRAAGKRLVRLNAQLTLGDLLAPDERQKAEATIQQQGGPTWFLLYYRDGDVVRSELSLAKRVSEAGNLLEWFERLLLPDIDLLERATKPQAIESPGEVDVPVERRVG